MGNTPYHVIILLSIVRTMGYEISENSQEALESVEVHDRKERGCLNEDLSFLQIAGKGTRTIVELKSI